MTITPNPPRVMALLQIKPHVNLLVDNVLIALTDNSGKPMLAE